MDYVGKICPYCKTQIKAGEEVVICSNCEMPHHKDCWIENQGCTTFGCTGTIQGLNSQEISNQGLNGQGLDNQGINNQGLNNQQGNTQANGNSVPSSVFCPQCGSQNRITDKFCASCGNALITNFTNQAPGVQPRINTESQEYSRQQNMHSQQQYPPQYSTQQQRAYNQPPQPPPQSTYMEGQQYAQQHQQSSYTQTQQYPHNQQPQYGGQQNQYNAYAGQTQAGYQGQGGYSYYQQNQGNYQYYNNYHPAFSEGDLNIYIQSNSLYYIRKFAYMDSTHTNTSWNWCAFLFGACWFFYRKMYGLGWGLIGAYIFINFLGVFGSLLGLALPIVLGIFGNDFYRKQAYADISKAANMDSYQKKMYLTHKGGVNGGAVVALVFGTLALVLVLAAIVAAGGY